MPPRTNPETRLAGAYGGCLPQKTKRATTNELCVSLAVARGADAKLGQRMLGHNTATMPLNPCAVIGSEAAEQVSNKFEEFDAAVRRGTIQGDIPEKRPTRRFPTTHDYPVTWCLDRTRG